MTRSKARQWMLPAGRGTRGCLAVAMFALAMTGMGCATGNAPHGQRGEQAGWTANPQSDTPGVTAVPDPNIKTLYAMARILTVQGKEEQSQIILQRLIAEYPQFVPAYSDLSRLYMALGRTEEAMYLLDSGLRLSPGDPVLLNNAGVCLLLIGDYQAALTRFTQAAERLPREPQYRGNMALALALQERYEESLAAYRQILPERQARENIERIRSAHGRHGEWHSMDTPSRAPAHPMERTQIPPAPVAEREAAVVSPAEPSVTVGPGHSRALLDLAGRDGHE